MHQNNACMNGAGKKVWILANNRIKVAIERYETG